MLPPVVTALIPALLIAMMFGMGASLSWERVRAVARAPRAFLIGTASQFGWMPLIAYLLSRALDLPDEAALGLVVMGTCPGGATSNLFAHLAGGDVALSIAMTAASKVIGVVMMPLGLYLYASPFTSATMSIPYGEIVKTLLVLLVPVSLALALRARFGAGFARVAERVGSGLGILLLCLLVGVTLFHNADVLATCTLAMYAAAVLLGVLGMLLGALSAHLCGLPTAQRRTVSFETGVQNSPLCFAILVTAFPGEGQLELLRLPMLYVVFVLTEAGLVTALYRLLDAMRAPALPAASVEPRLPR